MAFFRKCSLLDLLKQVRRKGRTTSSSSGGPVKWLDDAVTYADVQTSFVDPCTSLPFPEKVSFLIVVNDVFLNAMPFFQFHSIEFCCRLLVCHS